MKINRKLLAACSAVALGIGTMNLSIPPAQAIAVFDGANFSQNLQQAIHALTQINNQILQLANEAKMLANQARNLQVLPTSIAGDLRNSLSQVDGLIRTAEGIAYQVAEVDREYRRLFPEEYGSDVEISQIIRDAREAWALAREGYKHSLEIQAEVTEQIRIDSLNLSHLIAESQAAVGNLQVSQAGNQLTALAAKQSLQLQSLLAATSRAEALEQARGVAAREQARARFERFMGDGSAYTAD